MFKQYRQIQKDEFIVVGVDTAAGGGDFVAAQFLSKNNLDIPLVYHSKKTMTEFTPILHLTLERIYDETGIKPVIAVERANGGAFEMDRLAALNRLGKYNLFKMPNYGRENPSEAVRYGWDTNSATRPKMLADLKEAIDKKLIRIYDKETINELFSFVIVQTSSSWKAQAEKHSKDDLVMALAIAFQLYQSCQAEEKINQAKLYEARETVKKISNKMGSFF